MFGDFLYDPRHSKVTNLRFALTSAWSARSSSDMDVKFTSSDISTFVYAPLVDRFSQGGVRKTHAFDCERGQIAHTRRRPAGLTAPMYDAL